MKQAFTIVYPNDPTLKRVSLRLMFDGSAPLSVDLLTDFRKVSKEEVALSCAWWNLHGFFMNKERRNILAVLVRKVEIASAWRLLGDDFFDVGNLFMEQS
jgi:hypothetical protein